MITCSVNITHFRAEDIGTSYFALLEVFAAATSSFLNYFRPPALRCYAITLLDRIKIVGSAGMKRVEISEPCCRAVEISSRAVNRLETIFCHGAPS